jgi:hypothetical protein
MSGLQDVSCNTATALYASIRTLTDVATIDGIPYPPPGIAGTFPAGAIITGTGNSLPNPPIQAAGVAILSSIDIPPNPIQNGQFMEFNPAALGTCTIGFDQTAGASIFSVGAANSVPNTQIIYQQSNAPSSQYVWNGSGGDSAVARIDAMQNVKNALLLNGDDSTVLQSYGAADTTVNGAGRVFLFANSFRHFQGDGINAILEAPNVFIRSPGLQHLDFNADGSIFMQIPNSVTNKDMIFQNDSNGNITLTTGLATGNIFISNANFSSGLTVDGTTGKVGIGGNILQVTANSVNGTAGQVLTAAGDTTCSWQTPTVGTTLSSVFSYEGAPTALINNLQLPLNTAVGNITTLTLVGNAITNTDIVPHTYNLTGQISISSTGIETPSTYYLQITCSQANLIATATCLNSGSPGAFGQTIDGLGFSGTITLQAGQAFVPAFFTNYAGINSLVMKGFGENQIVITQIN